MGDDIKTILQQNLIVWDQNEIKWDHRFLSLAKEVAKWSKDPSTKVGAVIVDNQRRVIGVGYNGFARGVTDSVERLEDRTTKYAMVLHAEANAILQATAPLESATIYVTHKPCSQCSAMIIQSGITCVVTYDPPEGLRERFKDSYTLADQMLKEAHVAVVQYPTETL